MLTANHAPIQSAAANATASGSRYSTTTYGISAALLCMGVVGFFKDPVITLLIGAVICGWSEVDGFCGSSHVCSFAAIRTLGTQSRWLAAVSAYTLAGCVTASLAGAAVGSISLVLSPVSTLIVYANLAMAILLVAREFHVLRFELPQVHLQTQKMWAKRFGFVTAAGMWGAHIGLGVATVIRHGGFFVVLIAIALLGPVTGIAVMCSYWVGRTLPMWCGRLLTCGRSSEAVGVELDSAEAAYRHAAALGIALMTAALTRTILYT